SKPQPYCHKPKRQRSRPLPEANMTERQQQPVHIAHLIWHFSTGGLENGLVNLINHLPQDKFRHSIITLTGHDPQFATRIKTNNVSLHCLNKAEGHDWGT